VRSGPAVLALQITSDWKAQPLLRIRYGGESSRGNEMDRGARRGDWPRGDERINGVRWEAVT
jgi:hypothetical protein